MTTELALDRFQVPEQTPEALDYWHTHKDAASQAMITALLEIEKLDDHLPSALGTWGRGSHAYSCTRQNALENLRADPDYPRSGATMLTFGIGNFIHAHIQVAWHRWHHHETPCTGRQDCPHSNILIEPTVDLRPMGHDVSGHIDMLRMAPDTDTIPFEIKSVSEYAFNKATGRGRSKACEGPKLDHVVQAGIYASGVGADDLRIIYVNKGKHDNFAEWQIPLDEVMPFIEGEIRLMARTAEVVAGGELPPRYQSEFGSIASVPPHISVSGKWGKPFFCSGCQFNKTCSDLPSGAVPLESVGLSAPISKEDAEDGSHAS